MAMVYGHLHEEPISTSVGRKGRGGGFLSRSAMETGSGEPSRVSQGSTVSQGNQSWGKAGWALGTGASGLPGREAEDTPSRHVPGRTGIQFPVLPTGDKGGDLRACSSCACSSARHFWGLEPGASIYWPRLEPVGEVRQGGQVTGSQTAPSVSLPSCPLHSLVSCFHAVFGTGPSLACPEPGYPCLGHWSWVGRAEEES